MRLKCINNTKQKGSVLPPPPLKKKSFSGKGFSCGSYNAVNCVGAELLSTKVLGEKNPTLRTFEISSQGNSEMGNAVF